MKRHQSRQSNQTFLWLGGIALGVALFAFFWIGLFLAAELEPLLK